jgi:hypothetical protein
LYLKTVLSFFRIGFILIWINLFVFMINHYVHWSLFYVNWVGFLFVWSVFLSLEVVLVWLPSSFWPLHKYLKTIITASWFAVTGKQNPISNRIFILLSTWKNLATGKDKMWQLGMDCQK